MLLIENVDDNNTVQAQFLCNRSSFLPVSQVELTPDRTGGPIKENILETTGASFYTHTHTHTHTSKAIVEVRLCPPTR